MCEELASWPDDAMMLELNCSLTDTMTWFNFMVMADVRFRGSIYCGCMQSAASGYCTRILRCQP